jgi:hypothetical protein
MSARIIPEDAKALRKAQDLIRDENDWCKGAIKFISYPWYKFKPIHVQRCAISALSEAKYYGIKGRMALSEAASKLYPTEQCIVAVNDNVGHAAVMKCFDYAINHNSSKRPTNE